MRDDILERLEMGLTLMLSAVKDLRKEENPGRAKVLALHPKAISHSYASVREEGEVPYEHPPVIRKKKGSGNDPRPVKETDTRVQEKPGSPISQKSKGKRKAQRPRTDSVSGGNTSSLVGQEPVEIRVDHGKRDESNQGHQVSSQPNKRRNRRKNQTNDESMADPIRSFPDKSGSVRNDGSREKLLPGVEAIS